ncbi:hypothetical protein AXX17_AT1G33830 [Arabidopsis thaliana]|uniref:Uncharacterized protein n=1 Tax=Arabidopsis thaliana TaxID=3702 RepID=A0A178W5K1_ARATH|nr:hypothetical protein AXX17_AT1G33830 [Arabidopsis thaliana]
MLQEFSEQIQLLGSSITDNTFTDAVETLLQIHEQRKIMKILLLEMIGRIG